MKYGVIPVCMAGKLTTLNRLICRQREDKCPDTEAADSKNPVFQGKMLLDNDKNQFLLFDETCQKTNKRHVGFSSPLELKVLENSDICLSDGTFAVAQDPFVQLWCIHAQFGDSIVPVVHFLMSSRTINDYDFVIGKIKEIIPSWNPKDYLGDLEIGQSKAFTKAFPLIRPSFCYFHLTQAWYRKLKTLNLDDYVAYGSCMCYFWSLLKCLPFGDVSTVDEDFSDIWNLVPKPVTFEMNEFETYFRKFYIGRRPIFPPISWNVASRTIRDLPRTTNTVEASHRNLERCIQCTRGRSTPLISEILKCLRQEASKLKHDMEALEYDPLYKVSSERKRKDELKDQRIISVLVNAPGLKGIPFLKAIRAARRYL